MWLAGWLASTFCTMCLSVVLSVCCAVFVLFLLGGLKPLWYAYIDMISVGGVWCWCSMWACSRPVVSCMGAV